MVISIVMFVYQRVLYCVEVEKMNSATGKLKLMSTPMLAEESQQVDLFIGERLHVAQIFV